MRAFGQTEVGLRRAWALAPGHLGDTDNSGRARVGKVRLERWSGLEASYKPGCSEKSESDRPMVHLMISNPNSAI